MRGLKGLLAGCLVLAALGHAEAATLEHDYRLAGSLADALGGNALVAHGGSLSASGYSFEANQGLSVAGGFVDGANYSIETRFWFKDLTSWRKIVDFKNLSSDDGLYSFGTALDYCVCGTQYLGVDGAFASGVPVDVILTRDKTSGVVNGYINGVKQAGLSFVDVSGSAVFDGSSQNLARFFQDDGATGGSEASAGWVSSIRLYDGALSDAQASCVQGASAAACGISVASVPEPEIYALFSVGLAALALRRRSKPGA